MDWQQGVLIVLACVVGGLVVGYVSSYLLRKFLRNLFLKGGQRPHLENDLDRMVLNGD